MMNETMIGVDLAKAVFQVHGASMTGEPRFRKKLSRQSFSEFMAKQPPALVVMEACGSAHHWAREMIRLGHEVLTLGATGPDSCFCQRPLTPLCSLLRGLPFLRFDPDRASHRLTRFLRFPLASLKRILVALADRRARHHRVPSIDPVRRR